MSSNFFSISKKLTIEVINKDLENEIKPNDEVIKNLLRVKGAIAIKEAQVLADVQNFEEGENLLKTMQDQLKYWSNDKILSVMNKNMDQQRELISNERLGENSKINRQAFSMNLANVYMEQVSAPQFIGDCYQNETAKSYHRKLQSMKDGVDAIKTTPVKRLEFD